MSPDRSHLCMPLGRSPDLTDTLEAVGAGGPELPIGPQAPAITSSATAARARCMRPTVRDGLCRPAVLKEDGPPAGEQVAQCVLDPFPHLIAQLQHQPRVVGGLRTELRDLDRLTERDEPFR